MSNDRSENFPKKVDVVQKSSTASLYAACPRRPHEAPLTNTQTNKLPIGPHLTSVIRNIPAAGDAGGSSSSAVPLSTEPVLHSALQLSKALHDQQHQQPDVSLLLQQKVASPATASRIKKKVVSRLNHPDEVPVFGALVSAGVSETSLRERLEQQLSLKENATKPVSRPRLQAPALSDWYCPEDYVSMMPHSSLYDTRPQSSCVEPCIVSASALCQDVPKLMDPPF